MWHPTTWQGVPFSERRQSRVPRECLYVKVESSAQIGAGRLLFVVVAPLRPLGRRAQRYSDAPKDDIGAIRAVPGASTVPKQNIWIDALDIVDDDIQ